ncbi:Outer membrane protein, IML2, mitochondrial/Tetratricopeptide repeat protein 39 [Metarhizium album ARSEF 1941]|uniref:Inclusion body clearance protein IML2 n=1 Tax=Metarhizium album (strain ARSEF 1941) TaxID=1081103 RepID=A0A0B2WJK5_METAS|nr:Outer membrane protein, IML2, mitochondrial/Tetratricopeptide repeat protein 39 [Metarhizium album ARSEF 1941]KHN94118.1 Outer membrane protein, IML2, mitochondrial/Tetratricopeptide repeat protein 39 [Metarhizium album ARSEF 1941]
MSLLNGWFRSANTSADSLNAETFVAGERENLADALKWTGLIMNDDIDGAWQGLEKGESSFHSLGAAVTFFMRSILGFEKHVMAQTAAKLADCETRALADYKKSQKYAVSRHAASRVYPPGTEYELVRAQTQLMSAVVGVLNESLVEGMKSFYKLRKAFIILDGIVAVEAKAAAAGSRSSTPGRGAQTPNGDMDNHVDNASPSTHVDSVPRPPSGDSNGEPPAAPLDTDLEVTDAVDAFIHSGTNMCFGLILLILSLVPPAFSRMLSMVGFRGDRVRGVGMLWRSAAHKNINGAMAGMMLLAYYNSLLGTVDILPSAGDYDQDAESVGPPRDKCRELLADLRGRYPDSRLWRVEESRLHANDKKVREAIDVLSSGKESTMKQVTAVNDFELAINAMILQRWALMRDTFLRCLEISDWSHGVYYYMAGCASLELYRDAHHAGDETGALVHKAKTHEYLRRAPQVSGKHRLMARQLPLEAFIQRKLQKWEEQARAHGVDLADAIGPSPAVEMCYFWNGQKRMSEEQVGEAIAHLGWERCTADADVVSALRRERDDVAVWAIGMAALLRAQGKMDDAAKILQDNVLAYDGSVFKGTHKDDYVLPVATYELAVIAWTQCCNPPAGTADEVAGYRREKANQCQEHLEKVKAWETFVLDARVGMRVQSGLETLKWFKKKHGWA